MDYLTKYVQSGFYIPGGLKGRRAQTGGTGMQVTAILQELIAPTWKLGGLR